MTHAASGLWGAVDQLAGRAQTLDDLRTHRIHLIAARRRRAAGAEVPAELEADERRARVASLTAPVLLRRVREAHDGPLLVLKGPEVAAHYEDAALRPFNDLDLLVPDPPAAQRALIAAGFVAVGDPRLYAGIHHERPLAVQGLQLYLELHAVPKWPERLTPPRAAELFEAAVPSSLGIAGVQAPAPAHHALVLAAHSWAHSPLRRIGDLVDVALVTRSCADAELQRLAAAWGLRRLWSTTSAAAGALLEGRPPTWPLRTWARHLRAVRDPTVLETHVEGWVSGFWALPPRSALAAGAIALDRELRPAPGESRGVKLARTRLALRNARTRRSEHDDELERTELGAPMFYEREARDAADGGGGPDDP